MLLPWHVVVRARDEQTTVVEAANLKLMVASTGNPRLEPVAAAAGARLACAMAALSATDQRTAGYDTASVPTS